MHTPLAGTLPMRERMARKLAKRTPKNTARSKHGRLGGRSQSKTGGDRCSGTRVCVASWRRRFLLISQRAAVLPISVVEASFDCSRRSAQFWFLRVVSISGPPPAVHNRNLGRADTPKPFPKRPKIRLINVCVEAPVDQRVGRELRGDCYSKTVRRCIRGHQAPVP
jgi:hypothetical protein